MQADKVNGLPVEEARRLAAEFGPNALDEKKVNPVLLYLSYFWGPMPAMIWCVQLADSSSCTLNAVLLVALVMFARSQPLRLHPDLALAHG